MSNVGKSKLETEYIRLRRDYLRLKKLEGDSYFKAEEIFKTQFNEFLHAFRAGEPVDFTALKKSHFIDLCCMASSLRPCDPWQFLLKISMTQEKSDA